MVGCFLLLVVQAACASVGSPSKALASSPLTQLEVANLSARYEVSIKDDADDFTRILSDFSSTLDKHFSRAAAVFDGTQRIMSEGGPRVYMSHFSGRRDELLSASEMCHRDSKSFAIDSASKLYQLFTLGHDYLRLIQRYMCEAGFTCALSFEVPEGPNDFGQGDINKERGAFEALSQSYSSVLSELKNSLESGRRESLSDSFGEFLAPHTSRLSEHQTALTGALKDYFMLRHHSDRLSTILSSISTIIEQVTPGDEQSASSSVAPELEEACFELNEVRACIDFYYNNFLCNNRDRKTASEQA
ncbi:hypothetical protein PAPHI01_0262 [Pancytospora philotis]|nr:hypothetical protein PAPHI01_0262 [Pancytospora philotis]